jgi:glycosyltransferase involved in cell wall biosynthesis
MTRSLISVIIPTYNGQAFLAEALDSVLAQSFQDFEIIVVDDGSTDGTVQIVHQYQSAFPMIRAIFQENSGVTIARNRGIDVADGSYIAFLDQDDRWTPNALQVHTDCHRQFPELGYTLAHQLCFLDGITEPPPWFRLQSLDTPHTGYLPGTLMAKRSLFEQLGHFDPSYSISSDADWFSRAKDAAVPMKILPQILLERRIHADNQSRHSQHIQSELTQLLLASIQRKRKSR